MFKNLFKKKKDLDELSTSNIDEVNEIEIEEDLVADLKGEAENLSAEDINQHEKHFSDEKLWTKVQKYSKKAGTSVVYAVLLLYYTLQKPDVPLKIKATIAGALGYFILPLDVIPDFAVGVGYVDDLSVLIFALICISQVKSEPFRNLILSHFFSTCFYPFFSFFHSERRAIHV